MNTFAPVKRHKVLISFTILIIAIASCAIYFFTKTPVSLIEQAHQEQKKWDGFGIKNYHIVIKFYENFANGLVSERDVIVRNGDVISSSCSSKYCPSFVLTNVYTIDDLFSIAQGSTIADMGEEYNYCVQRLEFDWIYGFPKAMNVDCPRDADEEHSFEVILFEPLK